MNQVSKQQQQKIYSIKDFGALLPRSRACNNLHWTETDLGRFSQERRPRFLCISETSSNRSKSLMMSICVHRLTLQWARIWNEKIFLNGYSTRQHRQNGNLLAQKLLWFPPRLFESSGLISYSFQYVAVSEMSMSVKFCLSLWHFV